MTLDELFTFAYETHWAQPRFVVSRWGLEALKLYKRNISPVFGKREVNSITAKEVRHWLKTFELKTCTGNRSLSVFSTMYVLGIEEDMCAANPCYGIKMFRERKRERYATAEEIQTITAILDRKQETQPRETALIYALMYSGARPLSLIKAQRSDLYCSMLPDGTWGKLIFDGKSTSKTGAKERVFLPPKVVKMIFCLPKHRNGLLFGINKFPRKFWEDVRQEAGCPDLWARDWRRTFASLGLQAGVSLDAIGELLNHQSVQTTKIYAKLNDQSRVNEITTVIRQLDCLGTQATSSKVSFGTES
jgi:integrase